MDNSNNNNNNINNTSSNNNSDEKDINNNNNNNNNNKITSNNNNNNNIKNNELNNQQQLQQQQQQQQQQQNISSSEVIKIFEHLLRKSQRLFIGLRDLPQFGRQWQPFFQKTFELYTKLWKFQQQYRAILEDKTKYGLKRCEIGEIASKIGQLYYHYYLRTSDTNYLNESYIFYEAIRLRSYFKDVSNDKTPDMMVKQLRFYARFIVVCLLLNRKKVVFELIDELCKHVNDYTKIYKASDAQEWSLVLQEIFSFLQADQCVTFSDSSNQVNNQSHRLNPNNLQVPSPFESQQILQQAILVGSQLNQIKFSEITLDMFRMTQSLEYEPDSIKELNDKSKTTPQSNKQEMNPSDQLQQLYQQFQQQQQLQQIKEKRKNPHKYLLYRPTISQLLLFLSYSFKELGDGKALLLYISADGFINIQDNNSGSSNNDSSSIVSSSSTSNDSNLIYNKLYSKGLTLTMQRQPLNSPTTTILNNNNNNNEKSTTLSTNTANNNNNITTTSTTTTANNNSNINNNNNIINDKKYNESLPFSTKSESLYPMDLLPFCRKPFFLIVNSQSSDIFNDLPTFNQPFVSLLSPQSIPKKVLSNLKSGNIFTFFLHDPISAFCDITSGNKTPTKAFNNISNIAQNSLETISRLLFECNNLHPSFQYFLLDDFLRSFIVRFIFCHSIFYLHKEFQDNIYQVKSNPPLPKSILYNHSILEFIISMATELGVADQFLTINPIKNFEDSK